MNNFTHNIWSSIERFSYDVWVVKCLPNVYCSCVDHESRQAKNDCKKCLGTGKKIKIYKTKAVLREGTEQESIYSNATITTTPKMCYFKYGSAIIEKDDYVIDKEDIYSVLTKQYLRGEDGEPNTIKCTCPALKMDSKIILKNFKEVLNKYGHTL